MGPAVNEDLALILHTAELADGVAEHELGERVRADAAACPPELSCALLLQGRRVVMALEGPAHAVQAAQRALASSSWLQAPRPLAEQAIETRWFPGHRPRLVAVHPGWRQVVADVVAQVLARPDAANVQAMLRLLRGLAPA